MGDYPEDLWKFMRVDDVIKNPYSLLERPLLLDDAIREALFDYQTRRSRPQKILHLAYVNMSTAANAVEDMAMAICNTFNITVDNPDGLPEKYKEITFKMISASISIDDCHKEVYPYIFPNMAKMMHSKKTDEVLSTKDQELMEKINNAFIELCVEDF